MVLVFLKSETRIFSRANFAGTRDCSQHLRHTRIKITFHLNSFNYIDFNYILFQGFKLCIINVLILSNYVFYNCPFLSNSKWPFAENILRSLGDPRLIRIVDLGTMFMNIKKGWHSENTKARKAYGREGVE